MNLRILQNTLSLISARLLQPVITFFLVILVARTLGKEGLGEYSFALSYVLLFQIIGSLSFTNLIAREISRQRNLIGKYFVNGGWVALLFGGGLQTLLLTFLHIIQFDPSLSRLVLVASFSIIPSTWIGVLEGLLTGLEKIYLISFIQLMENAFRVVTSIILLVLGFGVFQLMLVFFFSRVLAFLFYLYFVLKVNSGFHLEFDRSFVLHFILDLRVFVFTIILVTLYWRLDILMLTKLEGTVAAGIYSAAYRLFRIFVIIPQSFVYSLFPEISRRFSQEKVSFQQIVEKGVRYLLMFSIPMTVLMIVLADQLNLFFYGIKFADSTMVLRILMLTIIPYSVTVLFGYTLVASNLQKFDLLVNAIAVAANASLNYILIHHFSYNGAALATLLSICVYFGVQYPIVWKKLFHIQFRQAVIKPLVASLIVGGLLHFVIDVHVIFNFSFGIIIYLGLLYWFSYFNSEEKRYFNRFILVFQRNQ